MPFPLGVLFGLIAMFGWGLADFFAKKTVEKIGDLRTLFWAQIVGFVILASVYFVFASQFSYTIKDIIIFALIGLIGSSAYLLFYRALEKGQVSILSPIQASWVIITVILSVIFLQEVLGIFQAIAIAITILGIILVSFKYEDLKRLELKNLLPGVPEDLISMSLWGVNFVIIGFLVSKFNWFVPIFFLRLFMIFFLLSFSTLKRKKIVFKKKSVIPWLIIIGVCDVSAFLGFGLGASSGYVSIVSPVAASFPLVTIILARVFLKERLSINQKIGVVGIIAGLILLSI